MFSKDGRFEKAQVDAGKIQKQREGAYERWQAAERKAQLEKQINEARERQKSPDKGIDDIDKRESIDIGNKIVAANKQRTDLQRRVESSRENFVNFRDELRKNIEAELSTAQKIGIDWDKFRYDTDYVAAVLRDFRLTDAEFKVGFEDVKFYYDQYNQFTEESNSLDQNLKDWNSQQEALITKYRWEGKDDAAAEIALLSKQYGEANEIIQASPLLPPEVRINLGARAQQQITEESLNQVSILYNYGYGDQAGKMLLSLENAAPEIKESVEYQKAVKSQLKFAQGVVEEKDKRRRTA